MHTKNHLHHCSTKMLRIHEVDEDYTTTTTTATAAAAS